MSKSYKLVLRVQNPIRDTTVMSFDSGSYNISGSPINVTNIDVLDFEQGSYAITGQDINFQTTETFDATFDETFG